MGRKPKEEIALMAHLFRRAGFGATYDRLEAYVALGYEAAVEELLHPESQPPLEEDLLLRPNMGWQSCPATPQILTYWFYKMINSRRLLEEKIALFWHGILCTGLAKIDHIRHMAATVDLYRRFGLGSFRDLLVRTAQDPGMIFYLDNNMSHKGAINENWGRELMELFSMGVGNYTEDDIKEASRAFTGWSIAPTFPALPWGKAERLDFPYDATDHDHGDKVFLGHQGRFNGEDIVDIICQQPVTARFLARQLYSFFVADEPPVPQWATTPPKDPEAIDALVQAYFDSHYDMRSILEVLFNSDFFKNARSQKVKSPTEVVVSTLRLAKDSALPGFGKAKSPTVAASGVGVLDLSPPKPDLVEAIRQCDYMGQELYNPPSVEGWHTGQEWIDSGTLVERVNFLSAQLGDGNRPGVREIAQRLCARGQLLSPRELVDGCAEQLGGVGLRDETRQDLVEFAGQGGSINTGSEDFTNRVATVLELIVATKEYQLN